MKFIFMFLIILTKAYAVECPTDRPDYFCKPVNSIENTELNEVNFYTVPVKILGIFQNEIKNLNYPVSLEANWQSPYFGAGVSLYENSFHLMILGGTARMKEMTLDGYAAIVCHEVGHLLGGDPKQTITGSDWASAEGQADHFSAAICLGKYFNSLGVVDSNSINKRIEKAGFDFINLATKIETDPKRKKFQRALVSMRAVDHTIINQYPSTQCRYETYRNPKTKPTCWFKD
jgi:hypothetical protein